MCLVNLGTGWIVTENDGFTCHRTPGALLFGVQEEIRVEMGLLLHISFPVCQTPIFTLPTEI